MEKPALAALLILGLAACQPRVQPIEVMPPPPPPPMQQQVMQPPPPPMVGMAQPPQGPQYRRDYRLQRRHRVPYRTMYRTTYRAVIGKKCPAGMIWVAGHRALKAGTNVSRSVPGHCANRT
jgi:hypothetical protein